MAAAPVAREFTRRPGRPAKIRTDNPITRPNSSYKQKKEEKIIITASSIRPGTKVEREREVIPKRQKRAVFFGEIHRRTERGNHPRRNPVSLFTSIFSLSVVNL
ncbi:hypothetical protein AAHA92_33443 [Salvia divinorum]|uniref:Ribosomal protein S7 n=1 Tax=Salvia divinorum TaxID=28513 RepID=A0ABD1FP03_SALDI